MKTTKRGKLLMLACAALVAVLVKYGWKSRDSQVMWVSPENPTG